MTPHIDPNQESILSPEFIVPNRERQIQNILDEMGHLADCGDLQHAFDQYVDLWNRLQRLDPDRFNEETFPFEKTGEGFSITELPDLPEDPSLYWAYIAAQQIAKIATEAKKPETHPVFDIIALQDKKDAAFQKQIQGMQGKLQEISNDLHTINTMAGDIRPHVFDDENDTFDLSDMSQKIENFQGFWERLQFTYPENLSDTPCPFPQDLDLTSVDRKQLSKALNQLEALVSKLEKEIPNLTMEMQTQADLYKFCVDILKEAVKDLRKLIEHINNNAGR